ncbi:MAG: hypothetical protein ACKVW3_00975 [Phycisphaerales bacterium]
MAETALPHPDMLPQHPHDPQAQESPQQHPLPQQQAGADETGALEGPRLAIDTAPPQQSTNMQSVFMRLSYR